MPNYRLSLAYDGTAYSGWQVQPGTDTIQGRLESALARLAKTPVRIVAAGRTDAGVHALGQVAHFRLDRPIPCEGIVKGLNSQLPPDIRALEVSVAEDGFHARFSARWKTYRYHLDRAAIPLPFRSRFTVHYPYPLDRAALEDAAPMFVGEHDFGGFRAASCSARTTVRHVTASSFSHREGELVYEVTGNGFLRHMVRNMVGTLLEIGRGRRPHSSIEELLVSHDRTAAGPTAPAKGLHLVRVDY
ncbi:MAG TPA: tRNA pseudouridine(38-40) synthase TruA [Vicinamibacteria bacterium]|nr:tRNA pseudouridine(38-40) synthase TruA [Vicinamibacteria bacterium]